MNKHTKSPWVRWSDGIYGGDIIEMMRGRIVGGTRICTLPEEDEYDEDEDEEHAANEALILSAPDYFEAVEQMIANEQCGGDGWWAGWDAIKAAHAKAKGGAL